MLGLQRVQLPTVIAIMTAAAGPKILKEPLYQLLREDKIEEFNRKRPQGPIDLRDANLRGCDLRKANLSHADLSGAYFRNADLRGVDLSTAQLDGASLASAQVSGCLFPASIAAEEIRLSLDHGTRLRAR